MPEPYWFSAFPFPPGHFRVHAVHGREALSKPYVFDVTVTAPSLLRDGLERLAIGHRAALVLRVGETTRVVPGIVESVRSEGLRESGRVSQTRFRVVPTVALLRHQRGSRIFQEMRVDQVVDQVLGAAGVGTRWTLTRPQPVRPYITQYEESDLTFVQRILAESGIFHWFDVPDDRFLRLLADAQTDPAVSDAAGLVAAAASSIVYPEEIVCFGDDASTYPAIPGAGGTVPSLHHTTVADSAIARRDVVVDFAPVRRVRSEVAEYREFDPARPTVQLSSRVGPRGPLPPFGTEAMAAVEDLSPDTFADFGAAAIAEGVLRLAARRELETYEHDGYFLFPDAKEVDGVAARVRRRKTKRRATATAGSGCVALAPGHRFRLEDHPIADCNALHVVVSVKHTAALGDAGMEYENTFECVPARVTYPPTARSRRTVQALVTATVIGPKGEDIHVDAAGRIKVHFHWDRRARGADNSCWIRTVQPWAGVAFGHQFIPRIGMEVAVTFEGGDPDKPVVIGSLYNGTHPPPFVLPSDKTKSGIRTQSTPGGGGFNELMFEDKAGGERVFLQAQKDYEQLVKNDKQTRVLVDESRTVGHDQSIAVGHDRRVDVARDHLERVAQNHSEQVGQHKTTQIGGQRRLTVYGDDYETVRGGRTIDVDKSASLRVGEHASLVAGDDKTPAAVDAYSWGSLCLGAKGDMILTSSRRLSLVCGESILSIDEDGIRLAGKHVQVTGTKSSTLKGAGPALTLDEDAELMAKNIRLVSKEASLVLDDHAHVDGTTVRINCDGLTREGRDEEGMPVRTKKLSLKLLDANFVPHAGKPYMLVAAGAKFEGTVGADGLVEHDIPEVATNAKVVVFLGDRPDGPKQRWNVRIEPLADVATVRGALVRLQNLGYWWSELRDEHDALVAHALRQFQADHALEVNGICDEKTTKKLVELHGH